jgi:hypothetical protein
MSDLLAVEMALLHTGKSVQDWADMYHDLPNRLMKVKVSSKAPRRQSFPAVIRLLKCYISFGVFVGRQIKDRNVITTTDAERKCTSPAGLQACSGSETSSGGKKREKKRDRKWGACRKEMVPFTPFALTISHFPFCFLFSSSAGGGGRHCGANPGRPLLRAAVRHGGCGSCLRRGQHQGMISRAARLERKRGREKGGERGLARE